MYICGEPSSGSHSSILCSGNSMDIPKGLAEKPFISHPRRPRGTRPWFRFLHFNQASSSDTKSRCSLRHCSYGQQIGKTISRARYLSAISSSSGFAFRSCLQIQYIVRQPNQREKGISSGKDLIGLHVWVCLLKLIPGGSVRRLVVNTLL
jgi:hypothetical protein